MIETLRPQLCEDLGGEPEAVFARFDTEPSGAASIARVHRARLLDGTEVVVKTRRPGIADTVSAAPWAGPGRCAPSGAAATGGASATLRTEALGGVEPRGASAPGHRLAAGAVTALASALALTIRPTIGS